MLSREQVWLQLAAEANKLRVQDQKSRGKWEAYVEALTLLEPEPLVLVDRTRPQGFIMHPTHGNPAIVPGSIAG